jgi:diguanylate cyclase/phosphodiesterase with PAS/PAC sensor(s)
MLVNLAFAGLLAALTVWRVGKVLTQRRQIEAELVWQASHDGLTDLVNRRAFEECLSQAMKPAKDRGRTACALMFIDLDQFKIVNDTCGHAAGDALLRRICPALQALLGPNDLLARLGGDEFGILMRKTDMTSALVVAESVRAAVEQVDFIWKSRTSV